MKCEWGSMRRTVSAENSGEELSVAVGSGGGVGASGGRKFGIERGPGVAVRVEIKAKVGVGAVMGVRLGLPQANGGDVKTRSIKWTPSSGQR